MNVIKFIIKCQAHISSFSFRCRFEALTSEKNCFIISSDDGREQRRTVEAFLFCRMKSGLIGCQSEREPAISSRNFSRVPRQSCHTLDSGPLLVSSSSRLLVYASSVGDSLPFLILVLAFHSAGSVTDLETFSLVDAPRPRIFRD